MLFYCILSVKTEVSYCVLFLNQAQVYPGNKNKIPRVGCRNTHTRELRQGARAVMSLVPVMDDS